jgi:hypothetical protein
MHQALRASRSMAMAQSISCLSTSTQPPSIRTWVGMLLVE